MRTYTLEDKVSPALQRRVLDHLEQFGTIARVDWIGRGGVKVWFDPPIDVCINDSDGRFAPLHYSYRWQRAAMGIYDFVIPPQWRKEDREVENAD